VNGALPVVSVETGGNAGRVPVCAVRTAGTLDAGTRSISTPGDGEVYLSNALASRAADVLAAAAGNGGRRVGLARPVTRPRTLGM
jgi:hypothetical protein